MAARVATEAEVPAEAPKPGLFTLTKKKLIIVGGVLALLAGAYFGGFIGGGGSGAAVADAHAPAVDSHGNPIPGDHGDAVVASDAAAAPKTAYFLDLPDITVNLNSADRRATFLKLVIALELGDAAVANTIAEFMPRIQDAFQVMLREVRITDLQGSAGIYRLKEELRRRVNLVIYPASIDGVLFKEILVQ